MEAKGGVELFNPECLTKLTKNELGQFASYIGCPPSDVANPTKMQLIHTLDTRLMNLMESTTASCDVEKQPLDSDKPIDAEKQPLDSGKPNDDSDMPSPDKTPGKDDKDSKDSDDSEDCEDYTDDSSSSEETAVMKVTVKEQFNNLDRYDVQCSPNETIRDFKKRIKTKKNYRLRDQKLDYRNERLQDNVTFASSGIKDGDEVQLQLLIGGGGLFVACIVFCYFSVVVIVICLWCCALFVFLCSGKENVLWWALPMRTRSKGLFFDFVRMQGKSIPRNLKT